MAWLATFSLFLFQSTLPRGSDHLDGLHSGEYVAISIHAPSRERPFLSTFSRVNGQISIHAPSRERPNWCSKSEWDKEISIHAPSRERPKGWVFRTQEEAISIHAPSRERPLMLRAAVARDEFQSTLPRGSDPACKYFSIGSCNFNPRSLAGATLKIKL